MARKRPYVGITLDQYEVFMSEAEPTEETYGHLYQAVVGPFRTVRAAKYMAKYGRGNPHLQTVAEAERIARKEAQG